MKYQAENLKKVASDIEAIAKAVENHKCEDTLMIYYRGGDWSEEVAVNFTVGEFRSKDGAITVILDKRLIKKLQKLRDYVKKPVVIRSGYRTPEHNAAVRGATHSQHMLGTAADIEVAGYTGDQLAALARYFGFTGIGIASNWIHVDVRDTPAEWRY